MRKCLRGSEHAAITVRRARALLNNDFRQYDLGRERKYWCRNDGKRTTLWFLRGALPGLVARASLRSRYEIRAARIPDKSNH